MKSTVKDPAFAILINGAETLVEDMQTPAKMLSFITSAMDDINEITEMKGRADAHRTFLLLIDEIVQPWFVGGPDMINNLAAGINWVHYWVGEDGLRETVKYLFIGLSKLLEVGNPSSNYWQKISTGLNSLFSLQLCLENYQFALKQACEEVQGSK